MLTSPHAKPARPRAPPWWLTGRECTRMCPARDCCRHAAHRLDTLTANKGGEGLAGQKKNHPLPFPRVAVGPAHTGPTSNTETARDVAGLHPSWRGEGGADDRGGVRGVAAVWSRPGVFCCGNKIVL